MFVAYLFHVQNTFTTQGKICFVPDLASSEIPPVVSGYDPPVRYGLNLLTETHVHTSTQTQLIEKIQI